MQELNYICVELTTFQIFAYRGETDPLVDGDESKESILRRMNPCDSTIYAFIVNCECI